jgi:hypothetical protein
VIMPGRATERLVRLPDNFQFSQSNLQDYVDCPRRFQLRYVLMQPWPSLITSSPLEFERYMQQTADFHRLARQYAHGIDRGQLAATIHDEPLQSWWHTFLDHPPPDLPQTFPNPETRPELMLSAPVLIPRPGYRLVARFDLLVAEPGGCLVIVDWKAVRKLPSRTALARRLQTRVYRYLAVEAGAAFNGGQRPQPERVEMVYWFAAHGGATERFPYDSAQHTADRAYLTSLVGEIAAREELIWPLTPNQELCRLCNYRSLCERGVKPGFPEELGDDVELPDLDPLRLDLEQIAEVEF